MTDPVGMNGSSAATELQLIDFKTHILPKHFDLFNSPGEDYLKWGQPLYRAAMESDWKSASRILEKQPHLATAIINSSGENVLHIAAGANSSTHFIKELVNNYMTPEDLALQSGMGATALMFIAQSGENVEAAKFLIKKNPSALMIRDKYDDTPLYTAVDWGYPRMASYLLSVTPLHQLTLAFCFKMLKKAILTKLYDVAMKMVNHFPELALYKDEDDNHALREFAKRPLKPQSTQRQSWTEWISGRSEASQSESMDYKALQLVDKLWEKVLRDGTEKDRERIGRVILDAARVGNVEIVAKIIGTYPPSIWSIDDDDRNIFAIATLNRQVEVFNLIYEMQGWKRLRLIQVDNNENNAVHLAAVLPPDESLRVVTGAALQMQRELLWFKEVESLVPPDARVAQNKDKDTPRSLFRRTHEPLRKEGEKWMKTTATSCFVVAALVATVAFTSAITLPGGDNQETGIPVFQCDPLFMTFAIINALSLLSSSIAILMFLGILTSRYAEEDFLKSLPLKLLVGLSSLFFSIAFMMVAFAATFFITFKAGLPYTSIPIVVAVLATIPIAIFAVNQFPLLIDIYGSTYQAKYIFRNNQRIYRKKTNGDSSHFLDTLVLKCLRKNN